MLLPLSLSVSLAEHPSASVPPGAQRVVMLELTFRASCSGDVAVHAVTLTHAGMGALRDVASVYAVHDGQRISRGRALSSGDGTVTLTFRPSLVVPACGTQEGVIMANFSSDAAATGEHRLALLTAGDIDAGDARVTLEGSAAAPVRRTVGATQGSIAAELLPLLQRVTYGDRRTVARLRLTADGTYDQELQAIMLTNDGSARNSDLQNLTLESSRGQVLARLPTLRDRTAPFVLPSPLFLQRGAVVLLTVRADVRASRRRTIAFTLEEPGDLVARRARSRR